VPTPATFAVGVLASTAMNSGVRDPLNFLLSPPAAKLRQTSAQSLTTSVAAAITFDVEDLDNVGGHSTVTNTSRYTAVYAGWYFCGGGVGYASNATGLRGAEFAVNGTVVNGVGVLLSAITGATTRVPCRGILVFLNVGDYVEVLGFQSSGGALNTAVTGTEQPSMSVVWESNA